MQESDSPGPADTVDTTSVADIEAYLKPLWQEMLQIATIETTESFPAIGGDSLMATRMLAEVLRVWGVSITLGEFYDADSISKLAALIQTYRAGGADPGPDGSVQKNPDS